MLRVATASFGVQGSIRPHADWHPMSKPPRKSERLADLRSAQRDWLRRALAHASPRMRSPSFTELAKISDLNGNTLTRFMNKEDYAGVLSTPTIRLVSDATGYPVSSEVLGENPSRVEGFRDAEAEMYVFDDEDPTTAAIKAYIGNRQHVIPWEMRSRALEYEGIKPGSVMLVDMNAEPRAGDVVCVQFYDWQNGRGETVFRVYEPPFLVAAGPDEAMRKPRLVDDQSVAIKGVVLIAMRPRGR